MPESNSKPKLPSGPYAPRIAVILAAGFGSRIQVDPREIKSKPLIKLGGLYLIERAIYNLAKAGIEKIRIVVGAYKEHLIEALEKVESLKSFELEFVTCPDFEKGNGASLAAGAQGLRESFLLLMADHVMSPDLISVFVKDVIEGDPSKLYLATDPNISNVFDLDDATKIYAEGSEILQIGKTLQRYNQIDTGLFYFPPGAASEVLKSYAEGCFSVSEIVDSLKGSFSFRAQPIHPLSFWQDVDTPQMAIEAEKRLLSALCGDFLKSQ